MKKAILSLIAIALISLNSFSQTPAYSWAAKAGSSANESGVCTCTDPSGNIYVVGNFSSDTIIFATDTLYKTAGDANDVYLIKYNAAGTILWIQSAGGPAFSTISAVTCDAVGNVYIAGTYGNYSINFGPFTLASFAGVNYNTDIFLTKYNSSGTVIWANRYAGVASDYANSLSADALGNIYLAGAFEGPSIAFGSTVFTTVTSSYPPQPFVAKIDSTGAVLWANRGFTLGSSQSMGVASDNTGNTYITGYCNNGDLTFGSTTLTDVGNGRDYVFVVKYNSSGSIILAESFGSPVDNTFGVSVSTDQLGNSYVAGKFMCPSIVFGTYTLTNTNTNVYDFNGFLIKLNSAGTVKWAKKVSALGDQEFTSIVSDNVGNVYTTGTFNASSISIGAFALTLTATSIPGSQDIFIAKYDSTGTVVWAKPAGGTTYDYSKGIAINGNAVYVTGYYNSALMHYDALTTPNCNSAAATSDMFICKLLPVTVVVNEFSNSENSVSIYPNPFTLQTTISFSEEQKNTLIKITDVLGKEIKTITFSGRELIIEKGEMSNGIYFVRIENDGSISSPTHNVVYRKIVVQ